MSELDSFFGDLLQDNFSTGDDFGSDFNTLDSLFSDSDASFANFDGLANDPILGNAVAKKEKMVPVATTVAPSTSSPVHAKLERPDIAAPLPTATAQFNLNQAPTTMLPVTTPIQWTPQVTPTTPFVFGQAASPTAATPLAGGNAALMPATLQANQFAYHRPLQPSLAPVPNKQFRRLVDLKEREEEDKKEKKRLAVRKCREKKRKEMKELESRAGTFDEEIKELRQQLKRARTEGMPTENPAKNLENVQALMSALRNSDNRALDAVTSKLVAHDCTATTPCSSAEAHGQAAVVKHFMTLSQSFSMANISTSFTFDSSSQGVIRCNWSMDVSQIAPAFGIHTSPDSSKSIPLNGGCRFTFHHDMLVDVVCTWDHSALVLQLLGIPSLQN